MQYTLVGNEDESFVTVFIPGDAQPLAAHSSHPNFDQIVALLASDDAPADEVRDLFDVSLTVARRFEPLSERVSVAHGRVFFDGDEVDNSLTKQILRFLDEDIDPTPLVNFFEKVQSNPQEFSREQLYTWLDRHDFTITTEGNILAYKGVAIDPEGNYTSINSGSAIVNGEQHNGRIPNPLGAIVEMPRQQVAFDPQQGCSVGLHVGTYAYASQWGNGVTLEVHVNPRDVVSVPTDCDAQKVRVCRYRVVDVSSGQRLSALVDTPEATDTTSILSLLTEAREVGDAVEVEYVDAEGTRSTRTVYIEAIAFGAGAFDNTLVGTVDEDSDEYRSLRLDRIQAARFA